MARVAAKKLAAPREESIAESVYERVKALSISFDLLPGNRINEIELAERLGVSRTPLREGLNRLVSEGFLTATPGKGFFRRPLDAKEIFDLFELRQAIEVTAAPIAIKRASNAAIGQIRDFLEVSSADVPSRSVADLVELDESFHEQIMALTGNHEMLGVLKNVNARIRFVRWIDMENKRATTQGEHIAIIEAIAQRDGAKATALLSSHIEKRIDQISAAIREGYARIYMDKSMNASGA
ncbi:GntR family transcriptional regulator [Rhizobium sp.]